MGSMKSIPHTLHAERDALAAQVDTNDTDTDVLVQAYHLCGVADIAVGQLRHMYQSVLVNTDVYEGSEIGDICHYAR